MTAAATVATVLLPTERPRVEAAGQGCYRVLHGESVEEAIRQVRRAPVDAVFLSVHRCSEADLPRVAQFVRTHEDFNETCTNRRLRNSFTSVWMAYFRSPRLMIGCWWC